MAKKLKMREKTLDNLLKSVGLSLLIALLVGCSSFSKGIVDAVLEHEQSEDTRQCWVRGRSFEGLQQFLDRSTEAGAPLKVLMVHGIGNTASGYSEQLVEGLIARLKLDQVDETVKSIDLINDHQQQLGGLRVSRYLSSQDKREFLFYELTWSSIIAAEKAKLQFDDSSEQSFRRAGLNSGIKKFVNSTIPDALMYNARFRPLIQTSVNQALCLMMSDGWASLPESGAHYCDSKSDQFWSQTDSEVAIISHSLGSRISLDALQRAGEFIQQRSAMQDRLSRLKDTKLALFMLSNQLPLLQLGQEPPQVRNQIEEICHPQSPHYEQRLFKELQLVSVSDPNDILSYAIPNKFVDDYIDSRLCPRVSNVLINVAAVNEFVGQQLSNPMVAHLGYDEDDRVLALLTNGIGSDQTDPVIRQRCDFVEAIAD